VTSDRSDRPAPEKKRYKADSDRDAAARSIDLRVAGQGRSLVALGKPLTRDRGLASEIAGLGGRPGPACLSISADRP
jgi:hypothetical protein